MVSAAAAFSAPDAASISAATTVFTRRPRAGRFCSVRSCTVSAPISFTDSDSVFAFVCFGFCVRGFRAVTFFSTPVVVSAASLSSVAFGLRPRGFRTTEAFFSSSAILPPYACLHLCAIHRILFVPGIEILYVPSMVCAALLPHLPAASISSAYAPVLFFTESSRSGRHLG